MRLGCRIGLVWAAPAVLALLAVLSGAAGGAAAQDAGGGGRRASEPPPPIAELGELAEEIQKMGSWEEQYANFVEPGMKIIWQDNGWNDESDRFALSMITEVARIPPWRIMDRLDKMASIAAQRYGLRPEQASHLKQSVLRETGGLLLKHGPMMMEQIKKAVEADRQLHAEGMAPESLAGLMAEFVAATEEMHADVKSSFDRVLTGFERELDNSQKAIFERDARTASKMLAYSDRMRAAWAAGRWSPRDWGMTDAMMVKAYGPDWMKAGGGASGPDATGKGPPGGEVVSLPTRWAAHDPHTWNAYARHVIARFRLDPAQVAAAWSVHDELRQRALDYLQPRRAEADKVEKAARAADPLYQPVRDLFDVLITRLDAIPTQAQRDAALP